MKYKRTNIVGEQEEFEGTSLEILEMLVFLERYENDLVTVEEDELGIFIDLNLENE